MEGKDFNFPAEEQKVLEFWERIGAFNQQLERTAGCKEYVFFDGPPFATGLPHYGHILAGTIKVCQFHVFCSEEANRVISILRRGCSSDMPTTCRTW